MTATQSRDRNRLLYAALAGSALIHAGALLALSHVSLRFGDGGLLQRPRFIEVSLQARPAVRAAPSRTVILPRASPVHRVGPASGMGGEPAPRPREGTRAAGPPQGAPAMQPSRPGGTPPVRQQLIPRPRPAASSPAPSASQGGPSGTTNEPPPSGLAGAGGQISLGAPSPAGDSPAAGSGGSTPGVVPGGGEGPGAGSGGGHGGSGEGSGTPGTGSGGGSGTGAGTGGGSGGGSGSGQGSGGSPGPARHVSRTADRSMPEVVRRVNPMYPASAQTDGVEGTVKMRVTVGTSGNVEQVVVVASSGDSRLDSAAVAAVRQWRYRPAVQNGEPRRVDTHATISFRLD